MAEQSSSQTTTTPALVFQVPRTVIFDLDGTLLDSFPGIRYSTLEAFRVCGMEPGTADLRRLIGPPIRRILAGMAAGSSSFGADGPAEADLDRLERAFRASYDSEGWRQTPHYEGASNLLKQIHATGRSLFVVSNKPRHISVKILEAEGTLALFDEVLTRDSRAPAYSGKVEMMATLLAAQEMDAKDCLMVGDTMEDAEAAASTGMKFCLMTHGYGDVPSGSQMPVALRLDHFDALTQMLAKTWTTADPIVLL